MGYNMGERLFGNAKSYNTKYMYLVKSKVHLSLAALHVGDVQLFGEGELSDALKALLQVRLDTVGGRRTG